MKSLLLPAIILGMAAHVSFETAHQTAVGVTINALLDEKELQQYTGSYKFTANDNFQKLTVTVENGDLYGQVDANDRYKLVKQTEPDTFKSTSSYGSVFTFTRDPNTKAVTGFRMKIMEYNLEGTREK
ncbi:DUF3471 domain-containing protein [Larkinella soli]|uniref:DUF3471 domain-containing protein n=1 Tax=Larkinella soli TaxID=1770527 RepID=UPI001E39ED38|nr:DUF3471 domain-containing protein [Larkinella soli]